MQITEPDTRVMHLVEELAAGPLPSWEAPPALLVLNKVPLSFSYGNTSLMCSLRTLIKFPAIYRNKIQYLIY